MVNAVEEIRGNLMHSLGESMSGEGSLTGFNTAKYGDFVSKLATSVLRHRRALHKKSLIAFGKEIFLTQRCKGAKETL